MEAVAFRSQRLLRGRTDQVFRTLRFLSGLKLISWEELAPAVVAGRPLPFSQVIDVRTAAEFAEDHIPGAVNLPILTNEEREVVGTTYADSQFDGRRLGAGLLCKNLGAHLETFFAGKDADFSPLVYCARGGLRSRGVSTILEAIGFKVTVLTDGYRSYRSWVRSELSRLPELFEFRVISGYTGSAKSRLLELLMDSGEQGLHLEALAKHKGSVLGMYPNVERQPSQRAFDSALVRELHQLSPQRPVWLEDESRTVGSCHLPAALWQMMTKSPHIMIQCPREIRAQFIIKDYTYLTRDTSTLKTQLRWLANVQSEKRITAWLEQIDRGDFFGFVMAILEQHYDLHYGRSRAHTFDSVRTQFVSIKASDSLLDEDFLTRTVVPEMIRKSQNCDGAEWKGRGQEKEIIDC